MTCYKIRTFYNNLKLASDQLNNIEKENCPPNTHWDINSLIKDAHNYFQVTTCTGGWSVELSCNNYCEISKREGMQINQTWIYRTVKVFKDLSWEAYYASKRSPSSLFHTTPSVLGSLNDLLTVLSVVEHTKLCCGVSITCNVQPSITKNSHGELIGCQEECIFFDPDGEKRTVPIYRAVNCMFYMPAQPFGKRCPECSLMRRNLSVQIVRLNEHSGSTSDVGPSKPTTNKRYLSDEARSEREACEKRRRINAEKREKYWRLKAVEEKKMRCMAQQSNEDLLTMFKTVDKGIGEGGEDLMFPENTNMSLFWSMQRDAISKAEHKKSIRWHPLYVLFNH